MSDLAPQTDERYALVVISPFEAPKVFVFDNEDNANNFTNYYEDDVMAVHEITFVVPVSLADTTLHEVPSQPPTTTD